MDVHKNVHRPGQRSHLKSRSGLSVGPPEPSRPAEPRRPTCRAPGLYGSVRLRGQNGPGRPIRAGLDAPRPLSRIVSRPGTSPAGGRGGFRTGGASVCIGPRRLSTGWRRSPGRLDRAPTGGSVPGHRAVEMAEGRGRGCHPLVVSRPGVTLTAMKSVATTRTPSPSHELLVGLQHLWHSQPWIVIAIPAAFVLSVVIEQMPRRRRRWP